MQYISIYKTKTWKFSWVFPGGPVVKNLPSNSEDVNSIPGQETKIPHALVQWRTDIVK